MKEDRTVTKKLLLVIGISSLLILVAGCTNTDTANLNANANAQAETRTGPDNSEITTSTDASGVRTETRVFRDNPRISKVVVTTRDGRRTAKAYSPSGEEKEINDVEDALQATGDALASSAGFVADKTEDVADETADQAKKVGEKTAETAEKVGDKTVQGAKKVGKTTADAAKKTGKTIKDAVTP
jgi:hypothetical protein